MRKKVYHATSIYIEFKASGLRSMALGVLFQEQSPPVEAAELTREEERPGFPFGFRIYGFSQAGCPQQWLCTLAGDLVCPRTEETECRVL